MDRLMNKNIIEGRRDGTSWHNSEVHRFSRGGKWCGRVQKQSFLPGENLAGQPAGESAEARVESMKKDTGEENR
jgi:hypothetical protein